MIPVGTPVDVYWNLHRDVFSVRSRRRGDYGRIIGHVDEFTLDNVRFVVHEAGHRRVLRERRKNVHAFVRGLWSEGEPATAGVRYNPYVAPFFCSDRGSFVHSSSRASGVVVDGRARVFAEIAS